MTTPETRSKISAALTGRQLSEDHRAKLRAARAGFKWSNESKARLAETQRRWFATHGWKRGIFKDMSSQERADYLTLRKSGRYTRAEALEMLGRLDLLAEANMRASALGGEA